MNEQKQAGHHSKKLHFLRRLVEHLSFFHPKPVEKLSSLFHRKTGKPAAKWEGYLQHYDRHFAKLKNNPLRLLEIGIQAGGSIEIWAQYFKSATHIIGCDIDPACGKLHYDDPRIKILIGDINTPETLQSLIALTDSLDIVIDDGSHHSSDIIYSFVTLFPQLADGGIYLIEDLHCSYWESYGGGLYDPFSAIAFFKKIVDIVNQPAWGVSIEAKDFLAEFEAILAEFFPKNTSLKTALDFLADIHSIEFTNSLCMVHKRKSSNNILGSLALSGTQTNDEQIGNLCFSAHQYVTAKITVPDQSGNIFSRLPAQSKEAQLLLAREEITRLKEQNIKLTTQIYESTKKFYDASITIQKLEYQLNQLEQNKSDTDANTAS